jgi:hypothetical protein
MLSLRLLVSNMTKMPSLISKYAQPAKIHMATQLIKISAMSAQRVKTPTVTRQTTVPLVMFAQRVKTLTVTPPTLVPTVTFAQRVKTLTVTPPTLVPTVMFAQRAKTPMVTRLISITTMTDKAQLKFDLVC